MSSITNQSLLKGKLICNSHCRDLSYQIKPFDYNSIPLHYDTVKGFNSHPVFTFDNSLQLDSIELESAYIPYSFWHVPYGQNTLYGSSGATQLTNTYFGAGNYSPGSFVTEWNNSWASTFSAASLSNPPTLSFDSSTNLFSITNLNPTFAFVFSGASPSILSILGLDSSFIPLTIIIGQVFTCPFPAQFGPSNLYLHLTNISTAPGALEDFHSKDIVAHIPVNTAANNYIEVQKTLNHPILLSRKLIKNLEIYFTDHNNNIINFNGIPFEVTFIISFLTQ